MKYRYTLAHTAALAALTLGLAGCDKADDAADGETTGMISTTGGLDGSTTSDAESGAEDSDSGADATDTNADATETSADTTDTTDGTDTSDTGTTGGGMCGEDPGWGQVAPGAPVKHIAALDHTGAAFNTCDLIGTPMAIDVSAVWCGPCNDASAYLAGNHNNDPFSGMGQQIRDVIDNGNVKWLTFITENASGSPAVQSDGAAWDAQYHHANIPVLTEMDTNSMSGSLGVSCVPSVYVVAPDNTFLAVEDCQTWNQLQAMLQAYG